MISQLEDTNLKILLCDFFGINLRALYGKFQLSSFKTVRERIEDDGRTYCKNAKYQTAPYGTKILLLILARKG